MALYIPASRRRRQTILLAVAALVVGIVLGALAGRMTAPSVGDRIRSVQNDARATAASLRVLSLHDQVGAASNQGPGNGGADLVLTRTRTELVAEFRRAPWLTAPQRDALTSELDRLRALPDRTGLEFGNAADQLASHIEGTFGG